MSSSHAHVGYNLGAVGAIAAIAGLALAAFGKPQWFVAILLVSWLSLWFLAAVLLSDAEKRPFLVGTLRHSNYTQIYTRLTRRGVLWIWNRLCDSADDKASWPALFRAALTAKLYDAALLLAVAYPILLLVGQWIVTGAQGKVGSFVLLPDTGFWPTRAGLVAALLILTVAKIGEILASASPRRGWLEVSGWLFAVAVAVAVAVAAAAAGSAAGAGAVVVAFAVVVAVAVAVVYVGAGPLAGIGASAVAVAFPVAIAVVMAASLAIEAAIVDIDIDIDIDVPVVEVVVVIAVVIAVISAVEIFDGRGRSSLARVLLTGAVLVALMIMVTMPDWSAVPVDRRSLFLFLAALPVLNGLFDFFSYALTLSLIRRGLRSSLPLLWGLADLALACLLFLALGVVLVVVVHGLNLLAGVPFVDLSALFAGIQVDPGAYVWLYLMLFSTVLPTALHGLVSLIGLQGLCPRPVRRWLARRVEAAPQSPLHAIAASLGLGLLWTLPVMCLVGLGWIAWHYGKGIILAGLEQYFHLLLWLAAIPIGAV